MISLLLYVKHFCSACFVMLKTSSMTFSTFYFCNAFHCIWIVLQNDIKKFPVKFPWHLAYVYLK